MDSRKLSAWSTTATNIVGIVVIVVSLTYLAEQVRQANVASQATAIHSFYDSINKIHDDMDEELFDIIRKGNWSKRGMSPYERQRYHNWFFSFCNYVHMG